MPSKSCAHKFNAKKMQERVDNLIIFMKNAASAQMTAKLHDTWAAPESTITEAQLLLTLGADPGCLYENDYGTKTLNDRVVDGSVCMECIPQFEEFLEFAGVIYEEMCERAPIKLKKGGRPHSEHLPLCLDGGGMRGLVSVVCLMFCSKRLLGNYSLPDYFDWLIGTSTGSILALSLESGRSLQDCFYLYWDMKRHIFLEGSTMSRLLGDQVRQQTKNIEKVLLNCFPTETFSQSSRRITVPALDISCSPARLHIFRNYSFKLPFGARLDDEQDMLFRDAARASGAAPTYFEPCLLNGKVFVDGSFVANYPLNVLFKEYDNFAAYNNRIKLSGVVSIGTGEANSLARKYKSGKSLKTRVKHVGHLSTLILEQVVGQDLAAVEIAQDRCNAQQIPFIRISPKGINVRIDQINDGKLMSMIWTTLRWLVDHLDHVDKLGELLYKLHGEHEERKRRSNTVL